MVFMDKEILITNLREVADFPKVGINFYDVSSLFKNSECIAYIVDSLYDVYKNKGITKVVGIESRGFVVGTLLAYKLGAGFVMCRKPGKLPTETLSESYEKEYGIDRIEIQTDAITADDVVLIHDDVLATGGTAIAAQNLVNKFNPKDVYLDFLIEIQSLGAISKFEKPENVHTSLCL